MMRTGQIERRWTSSRGCQHASKAYQHDRRRLLCERDGMLLRQCRYRMLLLLLQTGMDQIRIVQRSSANMLAVACCLLFSDPDTFANPANLLGTLADDTRRSCLMSSTRDFYSPFLVFFFLDRYPALLSFVLALLYLWLHKGRFSEVSRKRPDI